MNKLQHSYYNQTTLHPAAMAILFVFGLYMLVGKRRNVLIPYFIAACMIAPAQRLVVIGFDLSALRLLVIVAWLRILMKNEWRSFQWQKMDLAILIWSLVSAVVYSVQRGTIQASVYSLGQLFDSAALYFMFRCILRSWDDWERFLTFMILLAIPVAIFFTIEKATGRNLFSVFGGVPEITVEREGRLRVQGAFAHPILAGCFWASLIPLFVARGLVSGRKWGLSILGVLMALIMVFDCASSTPVMALIFGVIAVALFPLRYHMREVRVFCVATVFGLHMVMKAPVWHLLQRVNVVSGSTGYHRYLLVDAFVNRFNEWAMLGVASTAHWGRTLFDLTNQFVLEGVRGGLLRLVLFCWFLSIVYGAVGRMVRQARSPAWQKVGWSFGISLFMHSSSFISVSYFGQIVSLWFVLLAAITSLAPDKAPADAFSRNSTQQPAGAQITAVNRGH